MNSIALDVHDLTVAYDAKPVLWDIDLKIPAGCLSAIVGPNGAGKTTLIKAVTGLIKPLSGEVSFPVLGEYDKKTALKQIGYVPQSGSVDWDFPAQVQDIVLMGRYGHIGWIRRPGKKDREIAAEMLERVGMSEYSTRQISQLSGGQQQRVFLARALAQQAQIYFMDEPFKGVDAQTEKTIVNLLKEMKNEGKTVIVVHHDLHTVKQYFDRVTLLNVTITANGLCEEVFTEDMLKKTYRGDLKSSISGEGI